MGFFAKAKTAAGLLAIRLQKEGISVASIKRPLSGLPTVEQLAFFVIEKNSELIGLEKLAKDLHANRYQCANLLSAGEYQILAVEAPNVPPDELKTAVRWRLKDMLDFHIDDATIDVLDVPADKNAPARNHSMYAIAARNQLINQRQSLFGDAKIPLSVIDIPEMAQRNIAALMEPEGRGIALLSFDAEGGLLTVTYSGELYLARRIDVTANQLAQQDAEQSSAVFDRITLELQRSLDHFDRQYHFVTVSKLMLFSPTADSGLQAYLASNLYLPVETLNLEMVLDTSKVSELKSPEAQQRYFLTLGAALRHEEKAL
ncbi:agglutinin biogenesis protein MshI [Herbaspirillum sp. ST 5-3]|uniref:agglutinin biogenesis protein MshI n=1 Tax=Oxalobacteraceae TaxID=75682 RepID=UPI0010A3FA17|nr:agglutinin biogenesis protein MshI [Herbaspirillum sp. ST 5-3]